MLWVDKVNSGFPGFVLSMITQALLALEAGASADMNCYIHDCGATFAACRSTARMRWTNSTSMQMLRKT
jgi:hypothetical protein